MKILVTDGNNRATLAITRSLGKKGHEVFVGETISTSLAGASRYCQKSLQYPDPGRFPDEFIKNLLNVIRTNSIEIVLPVTEITTVLVTEHRYKLEPQVKIPFASCEAVKIASDKSRVIEISRQLNIPTPKTICLREASELKDHLTELNFPVVIKPSISRIFTSNGILATSTSYADNKSVLIQQLNDKNLQEFPVLLQERITGAGIGVFMCYNRGKLIAQFGHRRLREKPPSGGVSTLRESVPLIDSSLEYSKKILDHLNWHGVAMVEFKLDERDQIPKIMEINGRFWGSLQLAIDAGVDFPDILIRTLDEKEIEPVLEYKLGVKSRWMCGDLDALFMILFKSKEGLKLPPGSESRVQYLRNFLKFWEPDLHYEIESFSDPGPWWFEFRHWLVNKN